MRRGSARRRWISCDDLEEGGAEGTYGRVRGRWKGSCRPSQRGKGGRSVLVAIPEACC